MSRATPFAAAGRPLWRRVYEHILERFQSDRARGDVRLPPVRRLAEQTGVSIASVQRAYEEIDRAGLLKRFPSRAVLLKGNVAAKLRVVDDAGTRVPHLLEGAGAGSVERTAIHFQSPDFASDILRSAWQGVVARFQVGAPDLRVHGASPIRENHARRADAVMFPTEDLAELLRRGELRSLDGLCNLTPQDDLAAIPAHLFKPGRVRGVTWALPLATCHSLVYYNVDVFESLDVKPPTGRPTWLDVAEAAVAIGRAARARQRPDVWGVNLPLPTIVLNLADDPSGGWDDASAADEHADALQSLWEFYAGFAGRVQACWEGVPDTGPCWDDIWQDFRAGRLAMLYTPGFHLPALHRTVPFSLGAAPVPNGPAAPYHGPVMMLGVGAQAAHPVEGGRWIAHLLSRPGQESLAAEKLHVAANCDVLASRAWNDGRVSGLEAMGAVQPAFQPRMHEDTPRTPVDVMLLRPLAAKLFLGEISVDRACALFRAEHPRVLSSSWARIGPENEG